MKRFVGELAPGWRGGRSYWASVSSVLGSSRCSPAPFPLGPWTPTQTVTIRPLLSNVTEPQSAVCDADTRFMSRPSGPGSRLVSVCQASECRFERSFGAMNGWRGAS